MAAPNEAIDAPAANEPKTTTSTSQSPNTTTPAHQCRNCRASFCQPLGCGHVYCNKCLGPQNSLAPGNTGCPECDRSDSKPPMTLTPEPKIEHGLDQELRKQCVKHIRRISRVLMAMFILSGSLLLITIVLGIIVATNRRY